MKKLLISIVATASLALVAKADVLNSASFEDYIATKFSVGLNDGGSEGGELYWSGGGTDPEFKWVTRGEGEGASNALSIDVEEELVRKVKTDGTALNIGDGLYFDSWVQFTATEDEPEPTPGDKLIVWLKEIPGDTPTYKLCVTAAELNEEAEPTAKVFETSAQIVPETWNRLSIAAKVVKVGESNITEFKVYVNSTLLETGAPLYSLVPYTTEADDNGYYNRITSVSFKGKGAIDDLVWTNEDPFVAPTAEVALSFTYADGLTENDNVSWYYDGEKDIVADNGKASLNFAVGTKVVFTCETPVGYTVKDFDKVSVDGDVITWASQEYTVVAEGLELAFEITKDAPAAPKPFTVTIAGVDTPFETLDEAIKAAAANGDTIKLVQDIEPATSFVITTTVTIDLNGKTIKANDNDTDGNGVFWVKNGGVLTLLDSSKEQTGTVDGNGGSGWKMAVWADGGKVVIEGGTYVNFNDIPDPNNQYDLIYVKNGGSVEITGGTFKCQTPQWTLNKHNTTAGSFVVTGGRFLGYNPTNIDTDDQPVTSWCADGYVAIEDADGYYTVVRGYAVEVEAANAEVSALAAKYAAGATVSFTVKAAEDYEVTGVTMNGTTLEADNGTYSFTMPAEAVTITVATKVCVYAVEVKAANAEVSALADKYAEGATVTFTVTADEGYEVTSVTMNGTPLTADNGTYTFKMPAEAVTIVVTTYKEPSVEPNGDVTITEPISDTAKDFIKEQFPAGGVVIKVEVNGDTLKGDAAVKMINKVVDMFKGTPFVVDDQGVAKLELVFKVDDVMAIVNGLTGGYTLKAGNATFNTEAYEVVPRWYDIDKKVWDVDAPQDGATKGFFKLKVQKKAN